MSQFDDSGTIQFCLRGRVLHLSVPEFGSALDLYTEQFMEEEDFSTLSRRIHLKPVDCCATSRLVFPPTTLIARRRPLSPRH
ncbi:hypothetical protein J1N35_029576 [Gossypium stocksii]|uniref:Uncharacterized protein n=1 Tax=Gossypium stocksii TaxID=47602 RepID=A0A9D3UYZ4_9ROSI|nr:hypothetical protein J1N35_029576 [Gossypium stocksii]